MNWVLMSLEFSHITPGINNLCKGNWNLCARPVAYQQPSAKFYFKGMQPVYPVINFKKMDDVIFAKQ